MTEEIYIDGVNVAGCKYFDIACHKKGVFSCDRFDVPNPCKGYHCYYKQLWILKQQSCELTKRANAYNEKVVESSRYRSALERINRELLGVRGLSIHCEKQIVKVKSIIQEVLNG